MTILASREHPGCKVGGVLRAMNHDRWKPAFGFGMHMHADMEIITYVLSGTLVHEDSLGNLEVLQPHEVQIMTAGTGISHSEFNHSNVEPVEFVQIWILSKYPGMPPGYQKQSYAPQDLRGRLCPLASRDRREGSLKLWQNACLFAGQLDGNETIDYAPAYGCDGYLHVARGALRVNGVQVEAGDGVRITDEACIRLSDARQAEFLLLDS